MVFEVIGVTSSIENSSSVGQSCRYFIFVAAAKLRDTPSGVL
jgi:hypothetical protein